MVSDGDAARWGSRCRDLRCCPASYDLNGAGLFGVLTGRRNRFALGGRSDGQAAPRSALVLQRGGGWSCHLGLLAAGVVRRWPSVSFPAGVVSWPGVWCGGRAAAASALAPSASSSWMTEV